MAERERDWTSDRRFLPVAIVTLVSVLVMILVAIFKIPAVVGFIAFACFVISAIGAGLLVEIRARERGSSSSRAQNEGLWVAIKHFFKYLP